MCCTTNKSMPPPPPPPQPNTQSGGNTYNKSIDLPVSRSRCILLLSPSTCTRKPTKEIPNICIECLSHHFALWHVSAHSPLFSAVAELHFGWVCVCVCACQTRNSSRVASIRTPPRRARRWHSATHTHARARDDCRSALCMLCGSAHARRRARETCVRVRVLGILSNSRGPRASCSKANHKTI